MNVITGAAIYFIVWWITLFMVLPFGVQREPNDLQGNDPGAPTKHRILLKIGINTIVATILWVIIYLIDNYDIIQIRELAPSGQ